MQASEDRIGERLLGWYDRHARSLPWRALPGASPTDPYRVWLSEVMLQQTTVAAVQPYFARFLKRWPTIDALARASDDEVMSAWAGLGYYSRARNLIACARTVTEQGGFQASEAELRRLPGVGDYTAAAIAAIAFGEATVPVDANIERVVSRLFAISAPLPGARPAIRAAAKTIAPPVRHGDFAQALMDLGSGICTPRKPRCLLCPLRGDCRAYASGNPEAWPVKPPKKAKPTRRGTAWWVERDGAVLLVTRPARGMLGGMRALPDDGWSARGDGARPDEGRSLGVIRHGFTHFDLTLEVRRTDSVVAGEWWPIAEIDRAGLPTLFAKAARVAQAALEYTPAEAQPDDRDQQHDQAEIAPAVC